MKNQSTIVLLLTAALFPLVLAACQGDRVTLFESTSDEGRWRIDGTLIRSYDVTLTQAYDTISGFVEQKGWRITSRSSSANGAEVFAATEEGTTVAFQVWAPQGRATEIGIEYGGGNRIESARLLNQLESRLPGDRIGAESSM